MEAVSQGLDNTDPAIGVSLDLQPIAQQIQDYEQYNEYIAPGILHGHYRDGGILRNIDRADGHVHIGDNRHGFHIFCRICRKNGFADMDGHSHCAGYRGDNRTD
jgi:hypothetical protein